MEKLPLTSLTLIRLYIEVIGSEAVGGSSYSFQDLRGQYCQAAAPRLWNTLIISLHCLNSIDSIKKTFENFI